MLSSANALTAFRFDFDHSKEISHSELVLLMLCTTRGLCKVVGFDRPAADELEQLTTHAFSSIDRDCSGQISLAEFSDWVVHERSVVSYLTRFASTRVIYANQILFDSLIKQLCSLFVERSIGLGDENGGGTTGKQLACSRDSCEEIIKRVCAVVTPREVEYLVDTMHTCMQRKQLQIPQPEKTDERTQESPPSLTEPAMIRMDVFCTVMSSYVAFLAADEDQQHQIDLQELRVLLWLIRGKEPATGVVDSVMKALDKDHNGQLSALEWVSYALESDRRTGNLTFTTYMQLLFTRADRNNDAVLTLPELSAGLTEILLSLIDSHGDMQSYLLEDEAATGGSLKRPPVSPSRLRRRQSQLVAIRNLIGGLANEFMLALDQNESHQIEWYEFRQNLDYLEFRIDETKRYIHGHILLH